MTDKHMSAVQNIAKQLEREGYQVLVEPRSNDIPFDLSGYQPDILATKGDEHLLVEVKTTATRRSLERYKSIADTVARHPRWRFFLTTVAPEAESDDSVAPPLVRPDEIRVLMRRLDSLLDSDNHSLAVPYLWNALVAGLRARAFERNVPVDATSDLRVVSYMYSLGEISHEDYETMRRYYDLRSSLTHSITHSVSKAETLEFRGYVGKKLAEWGIDLNNSNAANA
jgi:REase_AHJR-like